MNKFSFVTQIGMIGIAVAIVLLYIKPQITTIRETQDLTSNYESETQNVSFVNESLKAKISTIEAISPKDTEALSRFVPDSIDDISVLKDLSTVLDAQLISGYDLKYKGDNSAVSSGDDAPTMFGPVTEHYFSIAFESSYAQLKSLLAQMETNNYLLQVSNLKIANSEDGALKVDMGVTVFTRLPASTEQI